MLPYPWKYNQNIIGIPGDIVSLAPTCMHLPLVAAYSTFELCEDLLVLTRRLPGQKVLKLRLRESGNCLFKWSFLEAEDGI